MPPPFSIPRNIMKYTYQHNPYVNRGSTCILSPDITETPTEARQP